MPIIKHVNRRRRAVQNRQADDRRGSARERGYTTAWDRFARNWLANHPLCVYCAAQGITKPADLVDHVEPHRGDPTRFWPDHGDDPETFFASSCFACHNGPKQSAERAADRRGVSVMDVLKRKGMWPKS